MHRTSLYGPPPGYVTGGPNASNSITMHSPTVQPTRYEELSGFSIPDGLRRVGRYRNRPYTTKPHTSGLLANFVDGSLTTNISAASRPSTTIVPYPNPSNGLVFVSGAAPGMTVLVNDVSGRQVKQEQLVADLSVDLSDHTSGVYMLTIADGNGTIVDQVQVILDR